MCLFVSVALFTTFMWAGLLDMFLKRNVPWLKDSSPFMETFLGHVQSPTILSIVELLFFFADVM